MDNKLLKEIINGYDTPVYVFDIDVLKRRINYTIYIELELYSI